MLEELEGITAAITQIDDFAAAREILRSLQPQQTFPRFPLTPLRLFFFFFTFGRTCRI